MLQEMNIAIHYPSAIPYSVKVCVDNIGHWLKSEGIQLFMVSNSDSIPDQTDLLWDPCCAGANVPFRGFRASSLPLVVTVHGAGWFTLPWQECYANPVRALFGRLRSYRRQLYWQAHHEHTVITVSNYARDEVQNALSLPRENVHVIYHGVDHGMFPPGQSTRDIFLHVSQCQPKKNVDRIIAAYEEITDVKKPPLVIVAPGFGSRSLPPSVQVVRNRLGHRELADYYRRAIAFVFPSLHETFGMPILEAMASGAPVITSDTTACREIASGHAIMVNPRLTSEIRDALVLLMNSPELRNNLGRDGIQRAAEFTWQKSAQEHLSLFRRVYSERYAGRVSPISSGVDRLR